MSALNQSLKPSEKSRQINAALAKWKAAAKDKPAAAATPLVSIKSAKLDLADEIKKIPASIADIPNVHVDLSAGHARAKAKFLPRLNLIQMPTNKDSWHGHPVVFHHEYGHNLHVKTGAIPFARGAPMNAELAKAMETDFSNWKTAMEKKHGDQLKRRYFWRVRDTMDEHTKELGLGADYKAAGLGDQHRVVAFFDTLGGLSGGAYGDGHTGEYYNRDRGKWGKMEVYANVYRAAVLDWPEYRAAFPLTHKWIVGNLKL